MADLGNIGKPHTPIRRDRYGRSVLLGNHADYLHVSGTVAEEGAAVARRVRVYDRGEGALVGEGVSDAAGTFSIPIWHPGPVTVTALDDDAGTVRNALILDRITPV